MPLQRPEVRNFMAACEKIQPLLARGARLEQDERELIEFCMRDLQTKMRASHAAA